MSVILILILASLAMALLFLGGFIWAVRSGQFEDTLTPSMRVLADEAPSGGRRAANTFREPEPGEAPKPEEVKRGANLPNPNKNQ